MTITTREHDGVAIVTVEGQIDSANATEAQEQILPAVEGRRHVILDLGRLTFMSSAGLRMMLLLHRQVAAGGGKVAMVGLSDNIRDTMEVTGFLGFFKTAETIDDAVKAVGAPD